MKALLIAALVATAAPERPAVAIPNGGVLLPATAEGVIDVQDARALPPGFFVEKLPEAKLDVPLTAALVGGSFLLGAVIAGTVVYLSGR